MKLTNKLPVSLAVLLSVHAFAGDLYLDNKKVTKSSYYTGQTGAAVLPQLSAREWLDANSDRADLGIRDYGFVIENEALNELTYAIANRLLAQWPGTVPPFAIFVQGDRSPLNYGAATTASREIFINYGVFLHAESEDELAAVIGHEIAHVLLEHGKALQYKKDMENTLEMATQARGLYATAEALQFNEATKEVSIDPAIEKDLKKSAVQKTVADKMYRGAHATLFSRGNEYEADKLALDLMVAAGYSPMGLKSSLERMAHSYDLSSQVSEYFEGSSKTLLEETVTAMDTFFVENEIQSQELDAFMDNAKDQFTDSALDFGKESLSGFLSRSHPVPDKRVEKITAYLYDAYPRTVRRRKLNATDSEYFASSEIQAVIEHYVAANEAVIAISLGDVEAARALAELAVTPPTAGEAYTRYAAYFAYQTEGRKTDAAAELKGMDTAGVVPVSTSADLATFLAGLNDSATARAMIDSNESYFGPIADYYPAKIELSKQASDTAEVQRLALECYESASPDSGLAISCARVSGVSRPAAPAEESKIQPTKLLGKMFKPKK